MSWSDTEKNQLRRENAQLRAEIARLRAALEQVEWDSYNEVYEVSTCCWCDGFETRGHAPHCARQSALRQSEGE